MFSYGIVGLPNAGKSTLFNALTRGKAAVANYPFCTIDPNVGVVEIPDRRLEQISEITRPEKTTPSVMQFVDIAGLVKGASRGEGLGNKFLGHIREVDAIAHVVRCFWDENVSHVDAKFDPESDVDIVTSELILADIDTLDRRIEKTARMSKSGDAGVRKELSRMERLREWLDAGNPARTFALSGDDAGETIGRDLYLLTSKPVIYIANVDEGDLPEIEAHLDEIEEGPPFSLKTENRGLRSISRLAERAHGEGSSVVPICAELEAELGELDEADRRAFLSEIGIKESGLDRLIRASYKQLDLITFYTIKGVETRAWVVPRGTRAPQAAGKIHSDMERGFIRAEVVRWTDLIEAGSFAGARESGLVRSEGRDYTVADGDVVLFRFNV